MTFRLQTYQDRRGRPTALSTLPTCTVHLTCSRESTLTHSVDRVIHQAGLLGLTLVSEASTTHKGRHSLMRGPFVHKKSQEAWQVHTFTTTLRFQPTSEELSSQLESFVCATTDGLGEDTEVVVTLTSTTPAPEATH